MIKSPTVFLDRDGTLNVDVGYPNSLDKIELIPGAVEAVKLFNRLGFKVIVVTNQSGVARGYMTEETVQEIHRGMKAMFAEQGAVIDGFYYCPHHPAHGPPEYRQNCNCRKPHSDMYLQAKKEHNLDFSRSVIIGDKYADVEGGKRLGMTAILVLTGEGRNQLAQHKADDTKPQPDFVAQDILGAARIIQDRHDG